MARPLSTSADSPRAVNGTSHPPRYSLDDPGSAPPGPLSDGQELESLRTENEQLRALCAELEAALQEATQLDPAAYEERMREYEQLLEEKNETIRQLHQQMTDLQIALEDGGRGRTEPEPPPRRLGPLPREDELLALSEELERERRQLQEDEQTLMEQMRQMEVSMARERAEMARQRNDLQRLYGEIRHELERLERNGALQSKIDGLKSKLQDAVARRGSAPVPGANGASSPGTPAHPAASSSGTTPPPSTSGQPAPPQPGKGGTSFMGRLFGGNK